MALLKDLIVTGASRFIGDAYFDIIKSGTWNGNTISPTYGGTGLSNPTAGGLLTANGSSNMTLTSVITSGVDTSGNSAKIPTAGAITSYVTGKNYITGNLSISLSGAVSGTGSTSITTSYAGTVPVNKGGTNKTSWTLYAIPYLSDTTTFGLINIGSSGQLLAVNNSANGYTWKSVDSTILNSVSGPSSAVNVTITSSTIWVDACTLPTTAGTYVVNITTSTGSYSGIFSTYGSTNVGKLEEIPLHWCSNSASATEASRLYAATNGTKLQVTCNTAGTYSLTIKFKLLI